MLFWSVLASPSRYSSVQYPGLADQDWALSAFVTNVERLWNGAYRMWSKWQDFHRHLTTAEPYHKIRFSKMYPMRICQL